MAAKRVGEKMKELWVAAKKDFADSSQDLKRDFTDIMEYARNKSKKSSSPSARKGAASVLDQNINQDVGAELLSRYKEEWAAMHSQTEQASKAAVEMDSDLLSIQKSVAQSYAVISRCRDEFELLSETVEAMSEIQRKVEKLGEVLQSVEQSIIECAKVKGQLECERKKDSLRIQQERQCQEKEFKVQHLNKVLEEEKRLLVQWNANQENQEMVARQQTFQEMFDQQMADYRQSGHLEKPILASGDRERSDSNLEEMIIEDKDGTASLNEFLSDVVEEPPNEKTEDN